MQKRVNKPSILIRQGSKKLTDDQSNLLLANQEHALDGAMDGTIFPWLCDMRAFLLLNHLEIFTCILLILSNCMIFLVQFGINKHWNKQFFNFVSLWKIYSCLFIPNSTQNHLITYKVSYFTFTQMRHHSFQLIPSVLWHTLKQ